MAVAVTGSLLAGSLRQEMTGRFHPWQWLFSGLLPTWAVVIINIAFWGVIYWQGLHLALASLRKDEKAFLVAIVCNAEPGECALPENHWRCPCRANAIGSRFISCRIAHPSVILETPRARHLNESSCVAHPRDAPLRRSLLQNPDSTHRGVLISVKADGARSDRVLFGLGKE